MAVRLSVSIRNARLVGKNVEDLKKDVKDVSAGRLRGRLEGARVRLVRYPAPFRGRYPWVSEKQRRYVIAAIRRGDIKVPYVRTGTYGRAWKVIKTGEGYALTGEAISRRDGRDYTKYVGGDAYGTRQARVHQGRWALMRDEVERSLQQLPREIRNDVVMVARRKGFKAQ